MKGLSLVSGDIGKDDTVQTSGSQHECHRNGKGIFASSGSKTMACQTLRLHSNPGGPALLSKMRVCPTTEEGGRQIGRRESDSLVVPVKAGNSAGGKEATHGSAE